MHGGKGIALMDLIAPRIFCIGTHHKTGTLWMRGVFRRLANALGVGHHVTYPNQGTKLVPEDERVFLFQWSSKFPPEVLERADARVLHMIRDPRDVLLSGMRYHQHAPREGEDFLHEPRDDLDGRTYQEHLNTLPNDEAKLMFELGEKHAKTVGEMLDWDYGRRNGIEVRYEDLIQDTEGEAFREHLRDLGLPEPEVETGAQVFWKNSLFGGLADESARGDRIKAHVASGQVAQWRDRLPPSVARSYADRFGGALVTLGYEDHPTRWLEEVRHAA